MNWAKCDTGIVLGFLFIILPSSLSQPMVTRNTTSVDVQLVEPDGGGLWRDICTDVIPLLEKTICRSPDGGFIEVGARLQWQVRDSPTDVLITKKDDEGRIVWQRTYGTESAVEYAEAVTQGKDGGYMVAAYTSQPPEYGITMHLLRIDEEGHLTWDDYYGYRGSTLNRAACITQADDGFVVVGNIRPAVSTDIYIFKIDSDGETVWERTYGGNKSEEADFIIPSGDGGFIVVGETSSFGEPGPKPGRDNVYILRIDAEGNKVWERGYGTSGFSIHRNKVIPSGDGGYVAVGRMSSSDLAGNYVLKTDGMGNMVWQVEYTDESYFAYGVTNNDPSGYSVAGYTQHYLGCTGSILFSITDEPLAPMPEAFPISLAFVLILSLASLSGYIHNPVISSRLAGVFVCFSEPGLRCGG